MTEQIGTAHDPEGKKLFPVQDHPIELQKKIVCSLTHLQYKNNNKKKKKQKKKTRKKIQKNIKLFMISEMLDIDVSYNQNKDHETMPHLILKT